MKTKVKNTVMVSLLLMVFVFSQICNADVILWQYNLSQPADADRLANGNTLIAGYGTNSIIEVTTAGTIVWQYTGVSGPYDADRLSNGNTLISDFNNNRFIEVDPSGTIVWEYTGVTWARDAERLANGNTLITSYSGYVQEVQSDLTVVLEYTGLSNPVSAQRLANGNTLITEFNGRRVKEVDPAGTIVWQYDSTDRLRDGKRLANGNTLITGFTGFGVIEITTDGTIVWEYGGLSLPTDADRLANGNTLISDFNNNRVIEVGAVAPDPPVATAATTDGTLTFFANWNASTGATGYYLDVATDAGFTAFLPGYNNLDVGNVTTYSVTALSAIDHYYRLRAYNASGTSGNSNVITVLGSTLPVELSTFNAIYNTVSGFVTLCWATASETDVNGFNIYRNTENVYNDADKINIDLIEGSGTTTETTEYSFTDETADPYYTTYYYWLEVINFGGTSDVHGSFKYIPIDVNNNGELDIITSILSPCYPNPARIGNEIKFNFRVGGLEGTARYVELKV
ncbi:MAG: hypothetical protein J7L75_01990, partial [Thermoproteales archaeon]|nr:hypothetical protein [Thermoproteales archaeon]